jgi:hypothetical protein
MENINDRISRYLSQKAGDKYIYLPYNMEFTEKVRLTASCEVKCGVIVKVEQPAESRTLNRLNQEWGL